jgi:hypothetical protein
MVRKAVGWSTKKTSKRDIYIVVALDMYPHTFNRLWRYRAEIKQNEIGYIK